MLRWEPGGNGEVGGKDDGPEIVIVIVIVVIVLNKNICVLVEKCEPPSSWW